MKDFLERSEVERYASQVKAPADATRIQGVTLLARSGEPMTVRQIVEAVEVGQSTVSHHLKGLAGVVFVLVERKGASSWYRLGEECVHAFPSAADVVMGRPAPARNASGAARGRRRSGPWALVSGRRSGRRRVRGQSVYALLLGLGALDAAGYSVIAPVLPGLTAQTGAGATALGMMVAAFPLGMVAGFALGGGSSSSAVARRDC
ncbi:ArsR/SmtB family transcription factor [Streptomyces sp. SD31]|uniref:ArsR/SmtB family transcription factor n=1 Tax=Streptomyces sp. SD31 TaxID=3452208 RepID=UPI003F8A4209